MDTQSEDSGQAPGEQHIDSGTGLGAPHAGAPGSTSSGTGAAPQAAPAIGIDLGTTNSLVAVWRNGQTELIANALGDWMTPSAVSELPDGSLLVGLGARQRLGTHPAHTATSFKRWMGTSKVLDVGTHSFRAEMLSSQVLSALRADAEAQLGCAVSRVVVTVPAYFNADQRHATKAAAQMAGFEHIHLLNEPTAAGLAYGLQTRQELNTFLVFDLGGGTFDVSILEYFEGVIQVRASAGDTRLGGEDFVQAMATLVRAKAGLPADADQAVPEQLWHGLEMAKRELSAQEAVEVVYDTDQPPVHITRAEYEAACAPLLQRLRQPLERALRDAQITPQELDEVVLVGGATRMPMVRRMLAQLFQLLPLRTINPDETVARGAAVYAGMLANDEQLQDVVLTDVMPFSLGVITRDANSSNVFSPIIERNTPVPVSAQSSFSATTLTQKSVELDIRQGESPFGSDNLHIGRLSVPLGKSDGSVREINVRFSYDVSGLLEVEVLVHATGKVLNHVLQLGHNQLGAQEVAAIRASLSRIKRVPRQSEESAYLLAWGKRLYEDSLGHDRQLVSQALLRLNEAVERNDLRETAQAQALLRQVLENVDQGFRL